eukprot:UN08096
MSFDNHPIQQFRSRSLRKSLYILAQNFQNRIQY